MQIGRVNDLADKVFDVIPTVRIALMDKYGPDSVSFDGHVFAIIPTFKIQNPTLTCSLLASLESGHTIFT